MLLKVCFRDIVVGIICTIPDSNPAWDPYFMYVLYCMYLTHWKPLNCARLRVQRVCGRKMTTRSYVFVSGSNNRGTVYSAWPADNHRGWTKALFRRNSLYPDISRLCPDPFQMARRVHLKCVSSDQFWWDFASLLTCDFICGDADCCQREKKSSEKRTPVVIWYFQRGIKMFSELMGIGKIDCFEAMWYYMTLHNKSWTCSPSVRLLIHTTLPEDTAVYENSLLTSWNDSF